MTKWWSPVLLLAGVVALAETPESAKPVRVGELSSTFAASPHPYPGGSESRPLVASRRLEHPGATYMVVHFSRFDLAPGDEVIVRDPAGQRAHRYSGQGLSDGQAGVFWSLSVPGDTVVVDLFARSVSGGYGFDIDQYEHGFAPLFVESICGANDKRDAECYRTSDPTYFDAARSVARLRHCGALCTGSLISCDNHFLSNQHCKGTCGITGAEAWFNYQRSGCGSGNTGEVIFQATSEVSIDTTLDYWLLQLGGDPVSQFGFLQLEPRPLVQDEVIFIPQHPGGRPKELGVASDQNIGNVCRIDRPNQAGRGPDTDTGYLCDTEGGSSGSPVLTPATNRLIALHHFGGCMNGGVRMENIGPVIRPVLPGCSFCAPLAAPASFAAVATGPNQVELTWSVVPGASSYRVTRAFGGCAGTFAELAIVGSSPYVDNTVSGGSTYAYRVEPIDGTGCRGTASTCASVNATGPCTLAPGFAGIVAARSALSSTCAVEVSWTAATGACSSNVVYNVYRSTTPGTTPSALTLVASCEAGTSWQDTGVAPGQRYYYAVRAEDAGGNGAGDCGGGASDNNLVEHPIRPTAGSPVTEFFDGGEGVPTLTLESAWSQSLARPRTGSGGYRAVGDIPFTCSSLTTPPLIVTPASVLSYSSRVENIELDTSDPSLAWDGGTVEISTDGGQSWSLLTPTPDYPKAFITSSNSCNNASRAMTGVYAGTEPSYVDASVALGAWAGQEVKLRFRFATDDASNSTAWWIDDVRVTEVSNADCGGGAMPPGEVSGPGAAHRLKMVKRPLGEVEMYFEERPEAVGYNLYRGDIATYWSHGAAPFGCGPATAAVGPQELSTTFTPGPDSYYYLITAWNGDPVTGQEGTTGAGRPASENTCPPSNNR